MTNLEIPPTSPEYAYMGQPGVADEVVAEAVEYIPSAKNTTSDIVAYDPAFAHRQGEVVDAEIIDELAEPPVDNPETRRTFLSYTELGRVLLSGMAVYVSEAEKTTPSEHFMRSLIKPGDLASDLTVVATKVGGEHGQKLKDALGIVGEDNTAGDEDAEQLFAEEEQAAAIVLTHLIRAAHEHVTEPHYTELAYQRLAPNDLLHSRVRDAIKADILDAALANDTVQAETLIEGIYNKLPEALLAAEKERRVEQGQPSMPYSLAA